MATAPTTKQKEKQGRQQSKVGNERLTSGSGASTYPADRDFKGHVGGVRGAAPQGIFLFFPIFFEFFCQIFKEKKGDVLTNI